MKLFCLHISLFFCLTFLGQSKQTFAIKIFLEDAETNKSVSDAKVTLEGFEIPAITGKYDKKGKFYYFNLISHGYNTIFVNHENFDEAGYKLRENIPKKVNINLNCKGNIFNSDTIYKEESVKIKSSINIYKYEKIAKEIVKTVKTRDEHKILISLKNSTKLSYMEIRKKLTQ